ncbi:hypothetical protein DSUL_20116 [Desulfovibrionales bacterium]
MVDIFNHERVFIVERYKYLVCPDFCRLDLERWQLWQSIYALTPD